MGLLPRWTATIQEAAEERQGQAPATSSRPRGWQYRGGARLHTPSPVPLPPPQSKELAPVHLWGMEQGWRQEGEGLAHGHSCVEVGPGQTLGLGSALWVLP